MFGRGIEIELFYWDGELVELFCVNYSHKLKRDVKIN